MKILDGSSQSEKSRHTKFQPNGRGWNTNKIAINIMETLDELPASTRPTKVHHKLHAATKEVYEPYIFKVHHQLRAANKEVYEPHIFKVHHQLRAANKEVYEPVLVSIGPYYHDKRKSQLQYMEQHKLRYLQDLLKRKEEKEGPTEFDQIREYLGVLEELEDEARGYYADPIALEKNVFLEMLLLDGCFIIELFRKAAWDQPEREADPLFKADWVRVSLARDLMLLENQIPFFVLERLHFMIGDRPEPVHLIYGAVEYLPAYGHLSSHVGPGECENALESISNLLRPKRTFQGRRLNPEELTDIKHILDLVRKFMLVVEISEMKDESDSPPKQGQSIKKYSATKLRELGVRFKGVEKRDYMSFMDDLVNTPKDVELLRHHGIIESLMGDDEVIAAMDYKACKSFTIACLCEFFPLNVLVLPPFHIIPHQICNIALLAQPSVPVPSPTRPALISDFTIIRVLNIHEPLMPSLATVSDSCLEPPL
ncbi:hypothetical protein CRG98_040882 [Punica granatum]|uniref:Uncharacterized protein n=1 Tax=Punica granatum TaxID=22663 RepID=A0A2I0I445_PUNGR|nr:hypothetical protein CRG98_040882 [Punica granatum]